LRALSGFGNSMHPSCFAASGVGTDPSHYGDGELCVRTLALREREREWWLVGIYWQMDSMADCSH